MALAMLHLPCIGQSSPSIKLFSIQMSSGFLLLPVLCFWSLELGIPQMTQLWELLEIVPIPNLENWSDDSTTLGAHYKSLNRLNPDVAIDKIEIIVGRNDNNPIGISLDEIVITEGPRYN